MRSETYYLSKDIGLYNIWLCWSLLWVGLFLGGSVQLLFPLFEHFWRFQLIDLTLSGWFPWFRGRSCHPMTLIQKQWGSFPTTKQGIYHVEPLLLTISWLVCLFYLLVFFSPNFFFPILYLFFPCNFPIHLIFCFLHYNLWWL